MAFESWHGEVMHKRRTQTAAKRAVVRWQRLSLHSALLAWKAKVHQVQQTILSACVLARAHARAHASISI